MDQSKKIQDLEKQLTELKSAIKPKKSSPPEPKSEPQKTSPKTQPAAKPVVKTKSKSNKGIVIGALVGVVVILGGVLAFFGYGILTADSYRTRDEKYERGYNYDDLTEAPWLSKSEDLAKFKERRDLLDKMGIPMDGDYYKDVMEADLESLLAELDSSDANTFGQSDVPTSSSDTSQTDDGDAEENPEGGEIVRNEEQGYEFMVVDASRWSTEQQWSQAGGTEYSLYEYCYQLDDTSYDEDWFCGTGHVAVFAISIMDQGQWIAYEGSEFGDNATSLGEFGGLYYIYEPSYATIPSEVDVDLIFQMLVGSFVAE